MSIRGRGGRFSHPRREENDNNCPEADNELLNEFISDKEHGRRRYFLLLFILFFF